MIFGKLLDTRWCAQRRRAWVGFLAWLLPQIGCFIWLGIEYHRYGSKVALDYEE
jgi:hypothetical protein